MAQRESAFASDGWIWLRNGSVLG